MAILLPSGKFSSETITGAPLVGGKVYAYVPNTSTPKDTYTSVTESVQNPHPVILDARGEATIYWSGSYDVILKDSNGVTIWGPERLQETGSADDLEARLASTASAADGDALLGVKLVATGSVPRTQHDKNAETVSVLDFGAVADGNLSTGAGTDNSAAFQAAFDWANSNEKLVYIPAGKYVLRSQVTVASNVRVVGAGMYRTILIAPNTFTGNGLLWATGAGGPPTIMENMALLGQTGTGAGAGSTGIRSSSNATLLHHVWVGGFLTQFRLDGTDCHATDCWADVSLSSGTGFAIENIGISLHQCVTFNCYTGILLNHTGAGPAAEPDGGVTISDCEIIQAGFSGISLVSPQNVVISNVRMHSPTATSKFTRDFITVDGGGIVTISDVQCTFGSATSTSCVGIRQTGETWSLTVKGCTITGADYGYSLANAPYSVISGNTARGCRTWGFRVIDGSPSMVMNGNQSMYNGTSSATDGGGYYLTNGAASYVWSVCGNSAVDGGSQSKYGFNITASATATSTINLSSNIVSLTTNKYNITGTVANVRQTANLPDTTKALATYDPPNLADGAGVTTTVALTGAVLGDITAASFSNDLQGITLTSWVSAANTVSVRFQNESGGALDLASGTLTVAIRN